MTKMNVKSVMNEISYPFVGKMKTFLPEKGFGFISVDDMDVDIFMHFRDPTGKVMIEEDRFNDLTIPEVIVEGRYVPTQKGFQVSQIDSIRLPSSEDMEDMVEEASGKMKSFNYQKGFGFLQLDDGRDVFVHKNDPANNQIVDEETGFLLSVPGATATIKFIQTYHRGKKSYQAVEIIDIKMPPKDQLHEIVNRRATTVLERHKVDIDDHRPAFMGNAAEKTFVGTLKFFNEDRNYGFIEIDDSDDDIHIIGEVFDDAEVDPVDGMRLQVKAIKGRRGISATKIVMTLGMDDSY